jgi:hypothetical protein
MSRHRRDQPAELLERRRVGDSFGKKRTLVLVLVVFWIPLILVVGSAIAALVRVP